MSSTRTVINLTGTSLSPRTMFIRGSLAALFGLFILFQTTRFIQLVAFGIGVYMTINGLITLWTAIRLPRYTPQRGLMLARSGLNLLVGLLAITVPFFFGALWTTIVYLVALQMLISAVLDLMAANRMRAAGYPWRSNMTSGLITLSLAAVLIFAPWSIGILLVRIIGFLLLGLGAWLIMLGWQSRSSTTF
ncbi:MAG: DUF308 domain-containing protein [Chloroflexota bacterium]